MLRRRILSISPADTLSSETGIVPTSLCESMSRYSRPNSSSVISASPSAAAACSSESTAMSQSWEYSAAEAASPRSVSAAARRSRLSGSFMPSKNPARAAACPAAVVSVRERSYSSANGAIARARSAFISSRRALASSSKRALYPSGCIVHSRSHIVPRTDQVMQ